MKSFEERIAELKAQREGNGNGKMPPPPPPPPPLPPQGNFAARRNGVPAYTIVTFAVLFCAAVFYLFPDFVLLAMLSIIGIPVALFLNFTALISGPLLLGQSLYWALAWRFPQRRGWRMWGVGVGAGVAIFVLAGVALNLPGRQAAQEFIAQDQDMIAPLRPGLTLGYIVTGSGQKALACDAVCMRLLLNGQARAVVIAAVPEDSKADPFAAEAMRWWLQAGTTPCPKPRLNSARDIGPKPGKGEVTPELAMLERIAQGDCLVSAPATLGEAEAVWAQTILQTVRARASYASGRSALTVHRLQLWQKREGAVVETYRRTTVQAEEIFPWPMPLWQWAGIEQRHMGWLRLAKRWNLAAKQTIRANPLEPFLHGRLGLDLGLKTVLPEAALMAQIDTLLASPDAFDANQLALISRFQENINGYGSVAVETWPFYLRLYSDLRLTAGVRLSFALQQFALKHPEVQPSLADAAFARLARGAEADYTALGSAISKLPTSALLAHRAQIFAIAGDPKRRLLVASLVKRLGEFGPEVAPLFLEMIDLAPHLEKKAGDETYIIALEGLCRAGPVAGFVAPQLLDRLEQRRIPLGGAKGELAVRSFLALGVSPDAIRPAFTSGAGALKPERFDLRVEQMATRPSCDY